jgi:hypothetical protein
VEEAAAGRPLLELWRAAHMAERLVARELEALGVQGEQRGCCT